MKIPFALMLIIFSVSCSVAQLNEDIINNKIVKVVLKERYYGVFSNKFCQNKNAKCPIVFAFQGGGGEALKLDNTSNLVEYADRKNVIVVYPNASNKHWNDGRPEISPDVDDLEFIDNVIADISKKYSFDKKRICAAGISNGGLFSFRLACDRSDIFSSVVPIAANLGVEKSKRCSPKKAVSVLQIMGDQDPLVPYEGGDIRGPLGLKKLGKVLSTRQTSDFWRNQLSCTKQSHNKINSVINDVTTIEEFHFFNCKENVKLTQVQIHGGGHTWPGGKPILSERLVGKTSVNYNASLKLLEFCIENPKK
jgi:polyhydroxybutyrate depolymerase